MKVTDFFIEQINYQTAKPYTGLGKLGDSMVEVVKCIKYLMKSADNNQLKECKKALKELLK